VWNLLKSAFERTGETSDEFATKLGNLAAAAKLVDKSGVGVTVALQAIEKSGLDVKGVFDVLESSITGGFNTFGATIRGIGLVVSATLGGLIRMMGNTTAFIPGAGGLTAKLREVEQDFMGFAQRMEQGLKGNLKGACTFRFYFFYIKLVLPSFIIYAYFPKNQDFHAVFYIKLYSYV